MNQTATAVETKVGAMMPAETAETRGSVVSAGEVTLHPLTKIFPPMSAEEFEALKQDIKERGLTHKITTYQGKILDGAHRYRACLETGVKPEYQEYKGDDPLGFVIAVNLHRRHLTESQRSAVAADLANMRQGERTDLEPSANLRKVSQAEAAKVMKVSNRAIQSAVAIRKADPGLFERVKAGTVSVNAAAKRLAKEKKPGSPLPQPADPNEFIVARQKADRALAERMITSGYEVLKAKDGDGANLRAVQAKLLDLVKKLS